MLDVLPQRFAAALPQADFVSFRVQDERSETLSVRQGVVEPVHSRVDAGVMVTVVDGGGLGYAATSDLSPGGLAEAARRAHAWARRTAGKTVTDYSRLDHGAAKGTYRTPVVRPWESVGLADKIDFLKRECDRLKTDPRIVDWVAYASRVHQESLYWNTNGADVRQTFDMVIPGLLVMANEGTETVRRSLFAHGGARQGGLEVLDDVGFFTAAPRIADEALRLLAAPNCPTGRTDLLLAPDQMILQIHESIGHPLELDRILGDERNYAGTSFVTLDMFGTYRYGSELLNVVWDPTRPNQLASYAFDDEGRPATREYVIKEGVLLRPLGGGTSQQRAGIAGVSTTRASGWNRPPIDRMANINLEPGTSTFDEMVASIERGVYMATNQSWSIDDSRNKFQFGCEYGQLIEDGRLTTLVKKPNYRGISATFWRNLAAVGNEDTFQVLGVPNCGKGEPNQLVRVGHASPACRFRDVEVFGGA